MIMSNGAPIVFYNPGKSKAQKERQRLAKQRKITNEKRLAQLVKQTKEKRVFQEVLLKQSKHLKRWRERKLILTTNMVGTFEVKNDRINATEWIPLSTITSCVNPVVEKGDPEGSFVFSFYGEDKNQAKLNFRFAVKTKEQRDHWIQLLKSHAPNCKK